MTVYLFQNYQQFYNKRVAKKFCVFLTALLYLVLVLNTFYLFHFVLSRNTYTSLFLKHYKRMIFALQMGHFTNTFRIINATYNLICVNQIQVSVFH